MSKKKPIYTNKQLAEWCCYEDLAGVLADIKAKEIIDPIMAERWASAQEALDGIRAILFPDGLEEFKKEFLQDREDENMAYTRR